MPRQYTAKGDGLTPDQINARKQSHFLRVLMENGGFRDQAIKTCRTSRRWLNEQLTNNEEFALAVQTVVEMTNEELLVEARRRATGYEEPIVYQGKIQGQWELNGRVVSPETPGAVLVPATVTKVSDVLLMFLIKGRMPEYRDGPGARKSVDLSDDELNEAIRRFIAKKTGKAVSEVVLNSEEAVN